VEFIWFPDKAALWVDEVLQNAQENESLLAHNVSGNTAVVFAARNDAPKGAHDSNFGAGVARVIRSAAVQYLLAL